MELPEIKKIQMQDLDRWFTTLVDALNFDLQQIEAAIPALVTSKDIQSIDTAPIQYLRNALDSMIDNLNKNFSGIIAEFAKIDERLKSLEGA